MATCETHGHLWGPGEKCVMCKTPKPAEHSPSNSLCPFCGGTVDPTGWMGNDSRGDRIQGPECNDCGATAPSLEVWNKRRTHEPPVRQPDGYAYRYRTGLGDVIRFNGGDTVNGGKPVEAIPFYYGSPPQPPATRPPCEVPRCDGLAMVCMKHLPAEPPSDAPKFKVGDRVALNFGRNHLDQGEIYIRRCQTTYRISCNGVDVTAWYEEHELLPYPSETKTSAPEVPK